MNEQDKKLLLTDLCGRLTYGVKVRDEMERTYDLTLGNSYLIDLYYDEWEYEGAPIIPYLRPMSSMTSVELDEMKEVLSPQGTAMYKCDGIAVPITHLGGFVPYEYMNRVIGWLLEHHFDYRGLIEKGLAIAVTEENNPYKE